MSAEHIKAFMLKKAPPPAAKQAKLVPHRPESESIVSYPKDVTNTVLLYAGSAVTACPALAHGPHSPP